MEQDIFFFTKYPYFVRYRPEIIVDPLKFADFLSLEFENGNLKIR
jgi:hypothetical protein